MADDLQVTTGSGSSPYMRTKESPATAGRHMQIVLVGGHVRSYDGVQSLLLTGSSQALTVPANAKFADIYAESTAATPNPNDYARYWQDGTAPTASVGKKLKDHEEMQCGSPSTFHAITGSGTITLRIEYYHYA